MKYLIYVTLCYIAVLFYPVTEIIAQTKTKSVPFQHIINETENEYYKGQNKKTIALTGESFLILSEKNKGTVLIERYQQDLKKEWQAGFSLQPGGTVTHFEKNNDVAYILTNHTEAGYQQLVAHFVDLKTGKNTGTRKLFEAPAKGRKIGVNISDDGSKIVAYQYILREATIRAIEATVFDSKFQKIKSHSYNFREYATSPSVQIRIDNAGNQYVCLLTDYFTKLTVRKYNTSNDEIKVMSVPVGGFFDGNEVFVFQTAYKLTQTGNLYATALCVDKKTSDYYSLKLVQCDFEADEMRFAPEFKFTPEYISALNKAQEKSKPVSRLDDIELSQILISPEKQVTVIAEKRYTEGGESSNYIAKELHLFSYDEYLNLAWRSIITKNQVAPAAQGFNAISFIASVQNSDLELITMEDLNGKKDLFLRRIDIKTGKAEQPKPFSLNFGTAGTLDYLKDFTAWLDSKTVVTVTSPPGKKTTGLLLNKTTFK